MSYGALSLNAHLSFAKAVKECGTFMGTGEGGLPKALYPYADHIITQVASGRFGVNEEYLMKGSAIEIKIGQELSLELEGTYLERRLQQKFQQQE